MEGFAGEDLERAGLAVGRVVGGRDHADRQAREFAPQPRDVRQRGSSGSATAEEDFELRVPLLGVGADGVVELRIAAAHGLQDGNGGAKAGTLARRKTQCPRDRQQIVGDAANDQN
jgi:hypothetical protein